MKKANSFNLLLFIVFSLLLFCTTNSYAQFSSGIKWQKYLGGTKDDIAKDILVNNDGTIVIAGSSKSNDGDISGHHGPLDSTDAWVAKMDAFGNLLWQKSIGGTRNDYFNTVIVTKDGAYLCIGYTESNNGDIANNSGYNSGGQDCFVVKISKDGDIIWNYCYGGSLNDYANDGIETNDGGYAIIGSASSYDGYVQSKKYGTTDSDGWIFKLDKDGNILWEKSLDYQDKTLNDAGVNILEDDNNSLVAYVQASYYTYYIVAGDGSTDSLMNTPGIVYTLDKFGGNVIQAIDRGGDDNLSMCRTGTTYYNAYFDVQYGEQWLTCRNYYRSSVSYFPVNGSGSSGTDSYNYYGTCDDYHDYVNFAPVHGIAPVTNSGYVVVGSFINYQYMNNYDAYISKSKGYFGGSGDDYFTSTVPLPNGREFITAGYTNSNDGGVPGNHGGNDCWVVWVTDQNKIVGNVFIDKNGNGIKDADEPDFNNATIKTINNGVSQNAIPYGGKYENITGTGTFTTTIDVNKQYYTSTNTGKTTVFSSYGLTDTINFPVVPVPAQRDYAVSIVALDPPKTDRDQEYILTYKNKGTDTLTNRIVYFIKDHRSQFGYSTPPTASISGDTLKWNVTGLLPETSGSIRFYVKLDPIPLLNVNDTLSATLYIDSTGDVSTANNLVLYRQIVKGSFDPNDKQEIHGGYITPLEMKHDQYLTYTIRFQNLGNDAAYNIIIRDTLSSKLDPSTVEMVSSSHPYKLTMQYGKNAVWTFENINLPDSTTNDSLSKGYVTYRVKPLPGFVTGDTIRNSASIYFDFNPPVTTNTATTAFTAVPCVWTGAISNVWENPLNWANGKVPDEGSDVYIDGGNVLTPQINSHAVCRSIHINPNATLQVNTGYDLKVGGEYLPAQ